MTSKQLTTTTTSNKRVNQAIVLSLLLSPAMCFAALPDPPDVSESVTYIGYAVAAIAAIGAAKMIPSAAMWLWSSLNGMAKRG